MIPYIYECPVYCGRLKEWRVLNLSTGTVYTTAYENFEEASDSIENGKKRAGKTVKRVTVPALAKALDDLEFLATHKIP
jgi:hypothetical protein